MVVNYKNVMILLKFSVLVKAGNNHLFHITKKKKDVSTINTCMYLKLNNLLPGGVSFYSSAQQHSGEHACLLRCLSTIAHSLNKFLKKPIIFVCCAICKQVFLSVINDIISERVHTHFNLKLSFVLETDVTPYCISAINFHALMMPDNTAKYQLCLHIEL